MPLKDNHIIDRTSSIFEYRRNEIRIYDHEIRLSNRTEFYTYYSNMKYVADG